VVAAETSEALVRPIADPGGFLTYSWLIAFLPAMSAVLTLFLGKRTPGKGSVYGIAAVGASLVLSLGPGAPAPASRARTSDTSSSP